MQQIFDPSLSLNDLPIPEAARIRALTGACKWLDLQPAPTKCFHIAAQSVTESVAGLSLPDGSPCVSSRPVSPGSMQRYYYSWKNGKRDKAGRQLCPPGNWLCFLDARLTAANRKQARTADRRFRAYLALLLSRHPQCATTAIQELWHQWDAALPIPGYEGLNYKRNMPRPAGWSLENLLRKLPRARKLAIVRKGIRAAAADLPQLRQTRKGGWPCCEVLFDDVWLDIEATGYDSAGHIQMGRPLQLGCLDAYTGKRLCWGTKIRTDRPDGSSVGLNADEMLFVLCDYLANVGYSPRGTVLVMEHGTAHISQALKDKLAQITGGLVRVEEGSIQGTVQPSSVYGGRGAGNPRRKAMLEEWHSLQRNRMDGIVTYTGHDRQEPEKLWGIRAYQKNLIKRAEALPAERRELLIETAPSLADVTDMLNNIVGELNNRTDHDLTDWAACGFTTLEFTLDRKNWTRIDRMPEAAQVAARAAVSADPSLLRQRNLSPQEAWEISTAIPENKLIRLTPAQIMELLIEQKARPLPPIKGGYIRLHNKQLHHEELIYEAVVKTAQGFERELPAGPDYFCVFNPISLDLYVLDCRGTVLGAAILSQRVPMVDQAAKMRALGRLKHRLAQREEEARIIVAQDRARQEITRQHNAAVLAGEPIDALGRLDNRQLRKAERKHVPMPVIAPAQCQEFPGSGLADTYGEPTFSPLP